MDGKAMLIQPFRRKSSLSQLSFISLLSLNRGSKHLFLRSTPRCHLLYSTFNPTASPTFINHKGWSDDGWDDDGWATDGHDERE